MLIGVLILISVGLIWTLTGVVMGGAKKHGIDSSLMQLMSSVLTLVVSALLILLKVFPTLDVGGRTVLYAFIMYFLVGASGYLLNETMARAMERGPNGLVWGILQSGTVIPFIVGVLFHGIPAPLLRICGMAMILVALMLMSSDRQDNAVKTEGKSWLFLSFIACTWRSARCCRPSTVSCAVEASRRCVKTLNAISDCRGSGCFRSAKRPSASSARFI